MEGFNICMQNPRQKASNARDKGGGKSFVLDANATSQLRNQGLASSDASPKFPHKVYTDEDLESILWSSVFNLDHIQPLDIHNVNPYKLKDFQEIMSYAKNDVAYFSFHQKVQRTTRTFGRRGERWRCTSNPYSKPAGKLCQIKKFTCYKKSDGCDQKEKGKMDEFVLKVGNKEDSEIKVLCRVYEEKGSETEEEKKKEEKEKAKQQKEEKANNKEPKCISKELQELSLVNKKTSLEEATSVEALLKEKEHLVSEIQQMKVHLTSKISCLEKELQIARENLKIADVAATEAKARCDQKNKRIQDLENRLVDAELRNVEGDKLRKKQLEQILELKGNLRVFVRVKPFLMKNDSNGVENEKLISYPTSKESPDCTIIFNGKVYTYDKVFGPEASQRDVFVEMTELVQSVLDGKNVSIFTYGQTGSGKTYTMIGESGDEVGIIPRSLEQIFTAKQSKENEAWNISIKLSIVEIYNDELKDFMGASENSDGSYLKKEVSSFDEVAHYLQLATYNRSTATTLMNEASSRSHLAFSLYICQSNEYTDRPVESTIIFIDLAGTERVSKSGAEGDQLKEAKAINASLSALTGMLLAMARRQTHIPYRDSTLTKFLMQYLGETSKKLMFVNVSPEPSNMSETANSLWFASTVNRTDVSVPGWKPKAAPGGKYRAPRAPILSPSQSRPLTGMWK